MAANGFLQYKIALSNRKTTENQRLGKQFSRCEGKKPEQNGT